METHRKTIEKLCNSNTIYFNNQILLESLDNLKVCLLNRSNSIKNTPLTYAIADLKIRLEILESSHSKLDVNKAINHKMHYLRKVLDKGVDNE